MYSTCLHCHGALGRNEDIVSFPVGKRLAFDAAKGRLWVICPACKRWNLSALEERWEAVEWCERVYRATVTRVATPEIGLARLRSGMEIVRIGKPMRPEFAAWRYGRRLQARHRSSWWRRVHRSVSDDPMAREVVGAGMMFLGGALLLEGILLKKMVEIDRDARRREPIHGLRLGSTALALSRVDLDEIRLSSESSAQWRLMIRPGASDEISVEGADALRLLGRVLTYLNDTGGSSEQVNAAVAKIEYFGGNEGLLRSMAQLCHRKARPLHEALGYEQRLAIEMVAHEESERLAMEGEFASLELAWREAEEISAIADDLLTPASILRRIQGARS